jgi:hypothetical protein
MPAKRISCSYVKNVAISLCYPSSAIKMAAGDYRIMVGKVTKTKQLNAIK